MSKNANPPCPACGSTHVAEILYGLPSFDEELVRDIESGAIVLGGCCVTDSDPDWFCTVCGCEFGRDPKHFAQWKAEHDHRLASIVYGAAVGDALGVPFEFLSRGNFECTGMSEGGAHRMPRGTFSDDTSMLLATCDSIRAHREIDLEDMRARFCAWIDEGAYTADGYAFDYGNTTATALREGVGCRSERSNGNGSLMRIAPLALTLATDEQIRSVSAITHAHAISTEACVAFVRILQDVFEGFPLEDAIYNNIIESDCLAFLDGLNDMPRKSVKSSGYVLDTLGAALWCALHTDSYRSCVLEAVNLGQDTDTTACVAGALAGAMYGFEAIPQEWLDQLRGKDIIERCLF